MKNPCVYIMASRRHGTLYVGVTSQLGARVWQHKNGVTQGFTSQYETMASAILREKQLKAGSRQRKIDLIEALNPQWLDLYERILG